MAPWQIYELCCDYSFFEIAKRVCEDCGAVIRSSDFGADVLMLIAVQESAAALFEKNITNSSAGKVKYPYPSTSK